MQKLKRNFVERNSYTRADKLSFHVSEIPPVVARKLSGGSVWNTEMNKKSQFLTKQSKAVEGLCLYMYMYSGIVFSVALDKQKIIMAARHLILYGIGNF